MVLYIDACVREESRTRRLADGVAGLVKSDGEEEKRICLYDERGEAVLSPLSGREIRERETALSENDFSAPCFDLAKTFAKADTIVIAAPYWDLSFPSVLKVYMERVCVCGITFRYGLFGAPNGLCRADKLYYVTTAGGEIGPYNMGYDYVRTLTTGLLGVGECHCIRAVGLDVKGVDAEGVLRNALERLPELISRNDR